jgi:zinc-finger of acetyl-transferase ESCO
MDKFVTSLPRGIKRKKLTADSDCKENKKNNVIRGARPEKLQMYIDVGQKSFGKSKQCKHCNFFYLIGDLEDEKEHNKFCASVNMAVSFSTLRILPSVTLKEYKNESKIVSVSFSNATFLYLYC